MNRYIITEEDICTIRDYVLGAFYEGENKEKIYDLLESQFSVMRSHPYQSEWDTVLDIICEWLRYNDPKGLYHYIKNELRQKVGELQYQCGDDCQGECSGEVTGTPFCPQPERDKVLGDEHYRNALSLCDNLLVHLEDNDITYLQIKKTVALVKKELQKFRQAGEP